MVALFYPTKENPYSGSFFKEQIEFPSSEYDISVLKYSEKTGGIIFDKSNQHSEIDGNNGIKQYYPVIRISLLRKCIEKAGTLLKQQRSHETAVGIYRSEGYRKHRRKQINKVIEELKLDYDLVYCITAQESIFQALQFAEIYNKPTRARISDATNRSSTFVF